MRSKRENSPFIAAVLAAIRANDLSTFRRLLGTRGQRGCSPSALSDLLNFVDTAGNTILHRLLTKKPWFWDRKKRTAQVQMLYNLLEETFPSHIINQKNHSGDTPLHLVIKYGYDNLVDHFLVGGAKITIADSENLMPISIAANLGKTLVYNKLLRKSNAFAKKLELTDSYTVSQLVSANQLMKKAMKRNKFIQASSALCFQLLVPWGLP